MKKSLLPFYKIFLLIFLFLATGFFKTITSSETSKLQKTNSKSPSKSKTVKCDCLKSFEHLNNFNGGTISPNTDITKISYYRHKDFKKPVYNLPDAIEGFAKHIFLSETTILPIEIKTNKGSFNLNSEFPNTNLVFLQGKWNILNLNPKTIELTNSKWNFERKLFDRNTKGKQQGVAVSISAEGDLIAIGAPADHHGNGAILIYKYVKTEKGFNWELQKKLDASDKDSSLIGSQQGWSVKISKDGKTVFAGAPQADDKRGAILIWEFINNDWIFQTKIYDPTGIEAGQGFSIDTSAYGELVVFGGPYYNKNSGATWICKRPEKGWDKWNGQIKRLEEKFDYNITALQGYAVSTTNDGDKIAWSAPALNRNEGAVFICDLNNKNIKKISPYSHKEIGGKFGLSLKFSPDGNILAIGQPLIESGFVEIYKKAENEEWDLQDTLKAPELRLTFNIEQLERPSIKIDIQKDFFFGISLAFSTRGDKLFVGEPNRNKGKAYQYIFDPKTENFKLQDFIFTDPDPISTTYQQAFDIAVSEDGNVLVTGASGSQDPQERDKLGGAFVWRM